MTRSNTSVKAVSDGGGTKTAIGPSISGCGVAALRVKETKALISLATDAISETHSVGHELHSHIYNRDDTVPGQWLQQLLDETFTCWQTADHYLRMLSDVLAERNASGEPEPPF